MLGAQGTCVYVSYTSRYMTPLRGSKMSRLLKTTLRNALTGLTGWSNTSASLTTSLSVANGEMQYREQGEQGGGSRGRGGSSGRGRITLRDASTGLTGWSNTSASLTTSLSVANGEIHQV